MNAIHGQTEHIYSIGELTARIAGTLREPFLDVWVSGEVSNFVHAGSGHAYLTLKDESAQLRAVIWRTTMQSVPFQISDGLEVLARGSIDVYAARGQYQLSIRQILPKGIGALELAFRQLRDKLQREGLFDPARKRPIPMFPKRVVVVTSPRGAAVRDFLEVAGRRWKGAEILVACCSVQGDNAPTEIVNALNLAQRISDTDVIALIRGGGSLEDLAAFNSEVVARTIVASEVPVVCGVGHEIDVTIADLVADLRALTPSEAAERIFPDGHALQSQLGALSDRLAAAALGRIDRWRGHLDQVEDRAAFRHPLDRLHEWIRRLDDIEADLLRRAGAMLDGKKQQLAHLSQSLDALSPLAILARGYAILMQPSTATGGSHRVVRSVQDVVEGQSLIARVADGRILCRAETKEVMLDG